MSEASPQYSPDGRWWWDGARWLPVTVAQPLAPKAIVPHKRRTWGLTAVIVVAVIAGLWVVWTAYMALTQTFSIDTNLTATMHSVVGGSASFTVTVTNSSGSDVKNFVIYAHPEGRDDWFKHHVVTSSGSCVADRSRSLFECGPIAKGSTETFTIQSRPADAGNFNYALVYADDRGGGDIASSRGRWDEWTEAVSP